MNSLKQSSADRLIVVDPCMEVPESESLNMLVGMSPINISYHLPSLGNLRSLKEINSKLKDGNYKGCIILGSAASVHDKLGFQSVVEVTIKKCLDHDIPLLSICYGHQLIASMFGAKVEWRVPERKKNLGIRTIKVKRPCEFWQGLSTDEVSAWVSHREQVVDLPRDAVCIAERDDCLMEGLQYSSKKAWSFQAHPEASIDLLSRVKSLEDPQKVQQAFNQIESGRYILRKFIKCLNS